MGRSKLTKVEQEILYLISEEFLTVKKIAIRRKTSKSYVHRIIRKLKEKGVLNQGSQKVHFFDAACEPFLNGIRLHGEKWHIKTLHRDNRYKEMIGKTIEEDGNTIRCHKQAIMIYSTKSFFGSDTYSATAKSIEYWNKFFTKLEWKLKVILIKPGSQNTTRVQAEYAQIKNGLAVKCEREAEKVRIRTREDGKIWFEIDNSFNFHEAETKHPQTAERDMAEAIEPFFNDLRDNPVTMSEIKLLLRDQAKLVKEQAYHNKETAAGLSIILDERKKQASQEPKEKLDPADYIG